MLTAVAHSNLKRISSLLLISPLSNLIAVREVRPLREKGNFDAEVVNVVYPYLLIGYYMYIETSRPRVQGDNAKLNSPLLQFSGNTCLRFFYHMHGSTIGTLNVIISGFITVFSASGNKGNKWNEARITVSLSGMYMVRDIKHTKKTQIQENIKRLR